MIQLGNKKDQKQLTLLMSNWYPHLTCSDAYLNGTSFVSNSNSGASF